MTPDEVRRARATRAVDLIDAIRDRYPQFAPLDPTTCPHEQEARKTFPDGVRCLDCDTVLTRPEENR